MNARRYVVLFLTIVWGSMAAVWGLTWLLPGERYMDGEYDYWMQQKAATREKREGQEILLLGDSRVKMGIRAGAFAENAYNLSLGGGSPIEMYVTLRDYLTCHEAPQAVIIAFAPMHYQGHGEYKERALYFHYLDQHDVNEVNQRWLAFDGQDFIKASWLYVCRLPVIYMKPVLCSLWNPKTAESRDILQKATAEKGRMFGHDDRRQEKVLTPEASEQHFVPMKTLDYYMGELLTLCTSRGIPVYVEQLPMGNPGREKLEASGYLDEYRSYMQSFADRYGVEVETEIPLYPADEFQDDSHLNNVGAERFTAELRAKYEEKLQLNDR